MVNLRGYDWQCPDCAVEDAMCRRTTSTDKDVSCWYKCGCTSEDFQELHWDETTENFKEKVTTRIKQEHFRVAYVFSCFRIKSIIKLIVNDLSILEEFLVVLRKDRIRFYTEKRIGETYLYIDDLALEDIEECYFVAFEGSEDNNDVSYVLMDEGL